MKRFATFVVTLALFFAAISSHAAIVYKNLSQPVSFQYFVPCANAGQGELVTFSGIMRTTLAETFANNWLTLMIHEQPRIAGIGETTGITYRVVGNNQTAERAQLNPPSFSGSTNDAVNFGIVGDGGNYHLHENVSFVFFIDSNGTLQFNSKHDNFFVFCK